MRILKRLVVWLLETSCEVLLLCLFLLVLSFFSTSGNHNVPARVVWFALLAISLLFMAQFGYLLTSVIVRTFWTNRMPWLHPTVSLVLFSIHLQIFFIVTGGLHLSERLAIQAGGAGVVFSSTFAGGYILRSWEQQNGNESGKLSSLPAIKTS
jgi:hypothetical protein